ncbi:MAG: tyrosine-type recombinase/integrase [Pseudomonadota bacterium]
MHRDDNPLMGAANRLPAHIERFFAWARDRGVLTIGRRIEAITWAEEEPLLLSGSLVFLSHSEVGDVLEAWNETTNNPFVGDLWKLSKALTVSFPATPTPFTTRRIKDQLHGRLEDGYLGAMLAARQAPDLEELRQDSLNCLRLWVLIKALEYARDGYALETNLYNACTYIRSALDESDPKKRLWLCDLSTPSTHFRSFEDALVAACKLRRRDQDSRQPETRRAILNLAEGNKLKHKSDPGTSQKRIADLDPQLWNETGASSIKEHPAAISLGKSGLEQFSLPDGSFVVAPVSSRENPDRQSAKVRRIALQSIEERQFLPCSWVQVRPEEQSLLAATIEDCLHQISSESALTAAYMVLATVTRRTMDTVGALKLTEALETDWTIDLDAGSVKRIPSRPDVRWKQTPETQAWTKKTADSWEFELQHPLIDVLRHARRENPFARCLSDLWKYPLSPYASFRRLCRNSEGLERISSHALGLIGERLAFTEEGDATYARLVMAPPSAGIAGSGSYPSWSLRRPAHTIDSISNGLIVSTTPDSEDVNGLGSELDPDDILLRDALATAARRVETGVPGERWIAHHNRLTAYAIAVLLACTAARPSRSPFESVTHFDLQNQRVYIEDKATSQMGEGVEGRIVPLPRIACELLSQTYLPYLRSLAEQLRPDDETMAAEVAAQADGLGSTKMPLFFFLREHPSFAWLEVTESALKELGGLDWPLPWNLFRHRLATRLRQVKLDPELIDAQLGHAEVGSESFGDTSSRCWGEDEQEWRAALEVAIAPLEIRAPRPLAPKLTAVDRAPGYRAFREASQFGRLARRAERQKNRAEARHLALRDIERQVGGRPPDSLTPQEWELIGRSMLFQEGNRPHSNASMRYEVFESFVQRLWHSKGIRVSLRTRYFRIPTPRSGHNIESLGAHDSLAPIKAALDRAFERTISQHSVRNASLLAALDLAITSRLADLELLSAVANADGSRVRLVIESQTAYLDYRENVHTHVVQPARRFVIPPRSAPLLNKALGTKAKVYQREKESEDILNIIRSAPAGSQVQDRQSLLAYVSRMVDLENCLVLPGVVCGVLAGRTLTYSLSHSDWIRAKHGERRVPNSTTPKSTAPQDGSNEEFTGPEFKVGDQFQLPVYVTAAPTRVRVDDAARADHDLLEKVRRLLRHLAGEKVDVSQLSKASPAARLKNSNSDSAARSSARTAIRELLKSCPAQSSSSVRLLAAWTVDLLERKSRRGGKLRPRSILRYLGALSGGFLSHGRNVDIRSMDETQLNDFYLNVVDSALLARGNPVLGDIASMDPDEDPLEPDSDLVQQGAAAPASRSGEKTSQVYVLERLMEFHRFAARIFELADPDWSEIGDGLSGSTVSTGFITPKEYQKALSLICPFPSMASVEDLKCAFVLLLTYRFGLRSGEAISLARTDWVDVGGTVVVLVNATHKAVKTSASRRQVPLLGSLTPEERSVVEAWMVHWQTETRGNLSIPLFFEHPLTGGVTQAEPVRRRLVAVLRAVTGVADMNLHKARHSFANILAANAVSPDGFSLWKTTYFVGAQPGRTCTEYAQAVIGSNRSNRRRLWGVSRALGHAGTNTTCGSYLHFMGEWCATAVMQLSDESFSLKPTDKLNHFVNLDAWINDETYLQLKEPPEPVPAVLTPQIAIQYMRAVARGIPFESAGHRLNIQAGERDRLHKAVLAVAARSADRSPYKVPTADGLTLLLSFLRSIRPTRWDALMDLAGRIGRSDAAPPSEDPFSQVRTAFQILAHKRGHFANIKRFLTDLEWSSDVRFFRPQKLADAVLGLAEEYEFPLSSTIGLEGSKTFQLASWHDHDVDDSGPTYHHRISMVRTAEGESLGSQAELSAMWVAYWSAY